MLGSFLARIRTAFDQGVGAAALAILLGPAPIVCAVVGGLGYREFESTRSEQLLAAMSSAQQAGRVNEYWAVEAFVLHDLARRRQARLGADEEDQPIAPQILDFWREFLDAGPGVAPSLSECTSGSALAVPWAFPALCAHSQARVSSQGTVRYVPSQGVERTVEGQVVLSAQARADAAWFAAFDAAVGRLLEDPAPLEAAGIVQAYFVGRGGSTALWSREPGWSEGLTHLQANDVRTAPYYQALTRKWGDWFRSRNVPDTGIGFSHPSLPVSLTVITRRYDDMLGAGIVWTTCLAVLEPTRSPDAAGDPWLPPVGDLLGGLCVDIADSLQDLEGLASSDGAHQSAWWSYGLLTLHVSGSETGKPRFVFAGDEFSSQRETDVIEAAKSTGNHRKDLVVRVKGVPGEHEEGFVLPVGQVEGQHRFLYIEKMPADRPPPGMLLAVGGVVFMLGGAMVWVWGWRRRAKVEDRNKTALLVDRLQVGVIRTDGLDRITFANDRAEELLGVRLARLSTRGTLSLRDLVDPVILIPDTDTAGWTELGEFKGRVGTLAEIERQRQRGQSSRYFARISKETLAKADAPKHDYHPHWCPWLEFAGSPRLDGQEGDTHRGVETYGVLRQVPPRIGWRTLEPIWKNARKVA